jgi:hypothetical protein
MPETVRRGPMEVLRVSLVRDRLLIRSCRDPDCRQAEGHLLPRNRHLQAFPSGHFGHGLGHGAETGAYSDNEERRAQNGPNTPRNSPAVDRQRQTRLPRTDTPERGRPRMSNIKSRLSPVSPT